MSHKFDAVCVYDSTLGGDGTAPYASGDDELQTTVYSNVGVSSLYFAEYAPGLYAWQCGVSGYTLRRTSAGFNNGDPSGNYFSDDGTLSVQSGECPDPTPSSSSSSSTQLTKSSSSSSTASSGSSLSSSSSTSSSQSQIPCGCEHPDCYVAASCARFSVWDFNGLTLSNTDNCRLYYYVSAVGGKDDTLVVNVYKDAARTQLVCSYSGASGIARTISFTEENASGVTGTVYWSPDADITDNNGYLECPVSSSSSSSTQIKSSSSSSSSTSSSGSSLEYSSSSSLSSLEYSSSSSSLSSLEYSSSSSLSSLEYSSSSSSLSSLEYSSSSSSKSSLEYSSSSSASTPSSESSLEYSSSSSSLSSLEYSSSSSSKSSLEYSSSSSASTPSSESSLEYSSSSSSASSLEYSSSSSSSSYILNWSSSSSSSSSSGVYNFTFDRYQTINETTNMGKDHFITLYSGKTTGKTASDRIFWGDTGVGDMTFKHYIELKINNVIYYTPVYTGTATLSCASELTGPIEGEI